MADDGEGQVKDEGQDEALAALDALGPAHAEPEQDKPPTKAKRGPRLGPRPRRADGSRDYAAEYAQQQQRRGGGRGGRPRKDGTPARPSVRRPNIAAGMAQLYTMAGLSLTVVPSGVAVAGPGAGTNSITSVTGSAIVSNAVQLGQAWEAAAKDDPRIREALEKLLAVSTLGQIAAAHLPIIMAAMCAAGTVSEATLVNLGMMEPSAAQAPPPPPQPPPGTEAPGRVYDFSERSAP